MRINRLALIEQLKQSIANEHADYVARCQAAADKEAEEERGYFDRTLDGWREFARRVLEELEHGHAITRDIVPQSLRSGSYDVAFFRPTTQRMELPKVSTMQRLINLLEASPDETVSLASLERAGFVLGRVVQ